jgi:hypothetical protein
MSHRVASVYSDNTSSPLRQVEIFPSIEKTFLEMTLKLKTFQFTEYLQKTKIDLYYVWRFNSYHAENTLFASEKYSLWMTYKEVTVRRIRKIAKSDY